MNGIIIYNRENWAVMATAASTDVATLTGMQKAVHMQLDIYNRGNLVKTAVINMDMFTPLFNNKTYIPAHVSTFLAGLGKETHKWLMTAY